MLSDIHSLEDFKKINQTALPDLAREIRERIIDVMKKNGGHLSSNLGTVELIIAIHHVFNSPHDKIIFDVGHQSYTHKIITGRNNQFDTVRLSGGISGFTRRSESVHDIVDSGHASVSISQAVGFAQAMKLSGDNHRVIALIGDGSLTGGEAFEGLNYTGHTGLPVIVILNDNEMSIGSNVGAISRYFNKIAVSKIYQNITDDIENTIKKKRNPFTQLLAFINKMKKGFKMLFDYENVFTNLGFEYIGPINGHDINELIYILERVKNNVKHPVLLHVKTVKGKGFADAEGDPSKFHGVTPYLMSCGKLEFNKNLSYTEVFGKKLVEMAQAHSDILAITAAMESGTGLSEFAKLYPDRFFDVGIAEQHAVSFASALAYGGYRPFVAIYSTFLTRAIDQMIQDVCISCANVVFVIDRAGIVGADGETHHGQFDISYLRMMPNLTLLIPFDKTDLQMAMEYAYSIKSPVAIRYPRDTAFDVSNTFDRLPYSASPFIVLKEGVEVLFIVVGTFAELALSVCDESDGACGVLCIRIAKPLQVDCIIREMMKYKEIIVIEESVFSGSISEAIGAHISKNKMIHIKYQSINLPDQFIEHGNRKEILNRLGFNKNNLKEIIQNL